MSYSSRKWIHCYFLPLTNLKNSNELDTGKSRKQNCVWTVWMIRETQNRRTAHYRSVGAARDTLPDRRMCHSHIIVPLIAHHFHIYLHYNTNHHEEKLAESELRVVPNTIEVAFLFLGEDKTACSHFLYHVECRVIPINVFFSIKLRTVNYCKVNST